MSKPSSFLAADEDGNVWFATSENTALREFEHEFKDKPLHDIWVYQLVAVYKKDWVKK